MRAAPIHILPCLHATMIVPLMLMMMSSEYGLPLPYHILGCSVSRSLAILRASDPHSLPYPTTTLRCRAKAGSGTKRINTLPELGRKSNAFWCVHTHITAPSKFGAMSEGHEGKRAHRKGWPNFSLAHDRIIRKPCCSLPACTGLVWLVALPEFVCVCGCCHQF